MDSRWLLLGLGLLALLLALSLVANGFLFRQWRGTYGAVQALRLDPLHISAFSAETPTPSAPQTVLFFGDSRAAFWPLPTLSGCDMVNRGVPGETAEQAKRRFAEHVAPLRPDVVVVQVGINDLDAARFVGEDAEQTVARVQANVADIVAQAQQLGATVVLTTVFPPGAASVGDRLFLGEVDLRPQVSAVNQFLRAMPDVVVVDSAEILAGDDGLVRPEYAVDRLHLSPAGYDALNAALLDVLRPLCKS